MNTLRIIGFALFLFFLFAFAPISPCEYAGSNINFVKTQTEKALAKDDINQIRYYAFKALNAIEKSKEEIKACKCEYAAISVEESHHLLKRATRTEDVKDSKNLLKRALQNAVSGIDALQIHDTEHSRKKSDNLLAINDEGRMTIDDSSNDTGSTTFKEKLNVLLDAYRKSLDHVVRTVNCKDARAYAENIYDNCEQELLKEGISEQKKYYNLRTQEITAEALIRIQEKCNK